ncbi:acyl-CoA dehydrogenase family protein [Lichenihabitans psoromatis]|uniref:acyl-CoA dehydrogenase family protein n=1 Tax=Lichenihabitans psoromatis TaxID=2528642 RepID=UPI001FDFC9A1|nr:acyl-CoA dehydrogenase family protein [Lichenihabitans psoromatis]
MFDLAVTDPIGAPETKPVAATDIAVPALTLAQRADAVAKIAAAHAVDVDRNGRFPTEAIEAIRTQRLFGILVPSDLGGEEVDLPAVVDVCYRLGRACASTAMIYAMHQTKAACVVRHAGDNAWQRAVLARLATDQLLFASSTTEGQGGGNVRSSVAPICRDGDRITLHRNASVISYGAQADAIVTTARRSEDAAHSDQVLAVFLKADYDLVQGSGWDTMGMRGTCSVGFDMMASGVADQILPVPYDRIHGQTMTPVAHLVWSGVWAGIAAAAVERAQAFTRRAMRQSSGQLPPGAAHFTKASSTLNMLRTLVSSSARRYEDAIRDDAIMTSMVFQTAITLLKVDASELAVATVLAALRACGLSGYRNDGEASVSRQLRDILSSPLMINNDRILASLSSATLMTPVPTGLGG